MSALDSLNSQSPDQTHRATSTHVSDDAPAALPRLTELLESGATPPYLARYGRDDVQGKSETEILSMREQHRAENRLEERKQSILRSLEGQPKATESLRAQIAAADSIPRLEDLYLPFRPGRTSVAADAIAKGLVPLADEILAGELGAANLDARLADFVDTDKHIADTATALAGAGKILAEQFSEDADARNIVRHALKTTGKLVCRRCEGVSDKKAAPYKGYFDYHQPLQGTPPHRVLAINRGERAGVLAVQVESDTASATDKVHEKLVDASHPHGDFLRGCILEAIEQLIQPSLIDEARRDLAEAAEAHSLEVFARNLRNLLLAPPLPGKRVMGVDPGYKTGCHVAVLDEVGQVLAVGVAAVVGEQEELEASRKNLASLVTEHGVDLIALGNGKASRPTEEMIASLLADELRDSEVRYTVVNESGASVYSTSSVAREELPDLDGPARCAVSIGRRLQDPLAELVKIEPASVGVGLYQHDLRTKPMQDALSEVVSSCVCQVGVDVNQASASLLSHVVGLNRLTARRLCEHRQQHGPFRSRQQIGEALNLDQEAYRQAAGFLIVTHGDNPLDATSVHPDHYQCAEQLLLQTSVRASELLSEDGAKKFREAVAGLDRKALAEQLSIGPLALEQIIDALSHPGQDPRTDLPPPVFRRGVVKFEDLQPGLELRGTVLNVVDFGAFIDVGLPDSGLVHISRMSTGFVSSPHELLSVGASVTVWVAAVDADKRRVSLTMIAPGAERSRPPRRSRRAKAPAKSFQPTGDAAGDQQGSRPAKPRSERRKKPQGQRNNRRNGKRGDRSGGYETRSKAPPKPITREMEEGSEAMRTFGDLLQFHRKKEQQQDDPPRTPPESEA